jgi:heat shock protein HslJ
MKKIIIMLLVIGMFVSCSSTPKNTAESQNVENQKLEPETEDISVLQGKWFLAAVEGNLITQSDLQKEAYIEFNTETMEVSGNSSVNQFGGPFTSSEPGKISFAPFRSTLMAGLNMEIENMLYQAFPRVTSYETSDGVLMCLDESGTALIHYTRSVIE